MKIVCISDTHLQYEKIAIAKCDILIIAGDIDIMLYAHVKLFFQWLREQNAKNIIIVPGNHDKFLASPEFFLFKIELKDNEYCLINSMVEIDGLKIWGSPFTPMFNNWSFMAEEGELKRCWDMIPKNIDILITHGPPHKVLDKTRRGVHIGSKSLAESLKRIKPIYHIFGHNHDGYGTSMFQNTTFVNCSLVNEDYDMVNKPIVIEV